MDSHGEDHAISSTNNPGMMVRASNEPEPITTPDSSEERRSTSQNTDETDSVEAENAELTRAGTNNPAMSVALGTPRVSSSSKRQTKKKQHQQHQQQHQQRSRSSTLHKTVSLSRYSTARQDMSEDEMIRMASNNPAMTVPASVEYMPRAMRRKTKRQQSNLQAISSQRTPLSLRNSSSSRNQDSDRTLVEPPTINLGAALSEDEHGWRRIVRNFSPPWFSVTMGTGVVSLIFITIPWKAAWIYWLAVVFFGLNTILFSLAFFASFLRYTLYPEIWSVMINDPTNSLFLGTASIGFSTLVECWVFLCCPYWGHWAAYFVWALWIFNSFAAVTVTLSLSYLLMSHARVDHLSRITAVQLLPIAATVVVAGTGAEVASILPDPGLALGTLLASYVMWGMSTPLAMVILVIYYQRLAVHKLPSREIIVSSFLPLGPLGMGSYGLLYLAKVAREVIPKAQDSNVPLLNGMLSGAGAVSLNTVTSIIYLNSILFALLMWAFGAVWFIFAVAAICAARPLPFNMGWWGFTFPLGVYSISTMTLGDELPSMFFRVLGVVIGVAVICLWILVASSTARGAWEGSLFNAPCLKDLKKLPQRMKEDVEKAQAAIADTM